MVLNYEYLLHSVQIHEKFSDQKHMAYIVLYYVWDELVQAS